MPSVAPPRTLAEIIAELDDGSYSGHLGKDDQWQVDVLVMLKGIIDALSA
jgi:hypothetical protein